MTGFYMKFNSRLKLCKRKMCFWKTNQIVGNAVFGKQFPRISQNALKRERNTCSKLTIETKDQFCDMLKVNDL